MRLFKKKEKWEKDNYEDILVPYAFALWGGCVVDLILRVPLVTVFASVVMIICLWRRKD